MPLQQNQTSWATEILRAMHGESRASEVRHLVLSLPKGVIGKEAEKSLRSIWSDWIKTYAPDRAWVFAIQHHNGILHGHGAVQNVGADARPLKLRPHQVKAMSEVKFSSRAISAKGIGKKGRPIYSKPRKKLAVQKLAELLVLPDGEINDSAWKAFEKAGIVTNLRSRKDGIPISFECQGYRIRFKTLRQFIFALHNPPQKHQQKDTMPTQTIHSKKPLSESLVERLKAAGFGAADLASLSLNLQAAGLTKPAPQKHQQKEQQPPIK
jgi:hypothetical protein